MSGFLLGFDIGSSFVKASLLNIDTGLSIARVSFPDQEMKITAERPGWAEQDTELWWDGVVATSGKIAKEAARSGMGENVMERVQAIGISYQMHGLVMVDANQKAIASSIIWCDSRAVEIGNQAFNDLGKDYCLRRFMNSPGNFTASKLKWVKENRPELFKRIHKIMLPGDFIAMKMTGEIQTTPSGLSEGILWDYSRHDLAESLLEYYGIPANMIADQVPVFSAQARVTAKAAEELGVKPLTPVCYRAGDQPNNALSLKVLEPGEVAATAGTSGVIYGVGDSAQFDGMSRVNTFLHVNNTSEKPRFGTLLCINGTGILNSWVKHNLTDGLSYQEMNTFAATAPVGAGGITILPFGNGAERSLANNNIGCSIHGLSFASHGKEHLIRAVQEGIVFALKYGLDIMKSIGIDVKTVRAGNANMFLSPLFREVFSSATDTVVELYETEGAEGAARGAGIGSGIFSSPGDAFREMKEVLVVEPKAKIRTEYQDVYGKWLEILARQYPV